MDLETPRWKMTRIYIDINLDILSLMLPWGEHGFENDEGLSRISICYIKFNLINTMYHMPCDQLSLHRYAFAVCLKSPS